MTTSNPLALKKAATVAATAWLAMIDAGEYAESWNGTSQQFQKVVSKREWVQKLTAVRAPLGSLVSRKVSKSTYKTSLPGAPDGQYVVLRFASSFTHKRSAIETIVMSLDQAKWKVAGYFIR